MTKRQMKIIKLKTVDSTNTYLRALAEKGEREGTTVIADSQTAGRGRRGKSFFSPESGLYMSILIRPEFSIEDSLFITPMTAVAVCRAIERVCHRKCGIKWVNDIYINEKKVSGILCEGYFDHINNKVDYSVVGIGINLTTPQDLPPELKDIFMGLDAPGIRDELALAVQEEFFSLYDTIPSTDFLTEYKERSVLTGKRIEVLGASPMEGTVVGIDERCHLLVKDDEGIVHTLSSGEVSTKIAR